MSYVVFRIDSGVDVAVYTDESTAKQCVREFNSNAGWERIGGSWADGIELEWCRSSNSYDICQYGPYGFTEYYRWDQKFNPNSVKNNMSYIDFQD